MQLDDNFLNLQTQSKSDFQTMFDNEINKAFSGVTEASQKKNTDIVFASPEIDQYRFQKDFDAQGFNAFDPNNEERWINNETWGSALRKGFDGFKTRFGNTFVDYWKDYGRMADALSHWDMSKMMPSSRELTEQYYRDNQEMMKNKVFVPHGDEDSLFSKSSISEFVSNSGFALGTLAAFSLEMVADAAITAVTAGAGWESFAASFGRLGAKKVIKEGIEEGIEAGVKQAVKKPGFIEGLFITSTKSADEIAANTMKEAAKITSVANPSNPVKAAISASLKESFDILSFNTRNIIKSKNFGEFALNVGKGIPVLGSGVRAGERMVAAGKAGYGIANIMGIGVSGVRRMAQELNMSSTEAGFEAISTHGQTMDRLLAGYGDEIPSAEDFNNMKLLSSKAAFSNYKTNMGVLLASNKLQFGTLFNRFPVHNMFLKKIVSEGAEDIVGAATKAGAKIYGIKGPLNAAKSLASMYKDMGLGKTMLQAGNMFRKNFLKFEVTEGLQELMQESSSVAWMNYYESQYGNGSKTLLEAFGEGAGEQWSPQGLKVFVHGAMTGGMIRIPTMMINTVMEQSQKIAYDQSYGKENNPIRKAEAQQEADIKLLNGLLNDYKKSSVSDLTSAVSNSMQMNKAAQEGNEYSWNNGRDNIMIDAILAAERLGTGDTFIRAVETMTDDMTTVEFEKAFGMDLSETNYKTPQEFAKALSKDLQGYSDRYKQTRKDFQKLIDVSNSRLAKENPIVAAIIQNKTEEAIQLVALNGLRGARSIERIETLKKEIAKIPGLEESSDYAFRILTDPVSLNSEIGDLKVRINVLKENMATGVNTAEETKKLNKEIELLEDRIKDLESWKAYWSTESKQGEKQFFIGHVKEVDGQAEVDEEGNVGIDEEETQKLFRKILNNKNKEAGLSEISEEAFQKSGAKMIDIIKLTGDAREYMDAYQTLYNPVAFTALIKKMTEGQLKYQYADTLEQIQKYIESSAVKYMFAKYNKGTMETQYEQADWLSIITDPNRVEEYVTLQETAYRQLRESTEYVAIIEEISSPTFDINNIDKLNDLMKKLIAKAEALQLTWSMGYDKSNMNIDISDEDMAIFDKDKTLNASAIQRIAYKLNAKEPLSEKENKVLEDPKIKKAVEEFQKALDDRFDPVKQSAEEVETPKEEAKADFVEKGMDKQGTTKTEEKINTTEDKQETIDKKEVKEIVLPKVETNIALDNQNFIREKINKHYKDTPETIKEKMLIILNGKLKESFGDVLFEDAINSRLIKSNFTKLVNTTYRQLTGKSTETTTEDITDEVKLVAEPKTKPSTINVEGSTSDVIQGMYVIDKQYSDNISKILDNPNRDVKNLTIFANDMITKLKNINCK